MRLRIILLFVVSILLTGCGGLAGEPGIVSTEALPTITPTSPPDLGYPPARASLDRGAAIFGGQQGCWLCHGIDGKGGGPTASQIQCPLPDFTAVDNARSTALTAWFAIVSNGTNGGQTCPMPAWKGLLDEQQRWDVTSYIYSLHYTPDLLAQGKTIWDQNCAVCHGTTGAGDGPKAKESARPVPNFTNPAYLIPHSDTDLWKTVTNGLGPVMPAFKDTLNDNARWAVVAYARSLSWEGTLSASTTPSATAAATAVATAQIPDTATIDVTGKITNKTHAAPKLPADQPLTLRVIDTSGTSLRDVLRLDGKIAADGTFSFANVQRQNGMVYIVTLQYAGLLQTSTPIRLVSGSGPSLDLSFDIYEVTADPAVIQIAQAGIFFLPAGQTMEVQEGLSFNNTSDRIFLTNQTITSGDRVSIELPLPADAQQVKISQDLTQQYLVTARNNLPVVQGIQPIYPGAATPLQFSYTLPSSAHVDFASPVGYSVQSLAVYTPQTSNLVVESADFTPGQPLQLQDGLYSTYTLQTPLKAGDSLRFSVEGPEQQTTDRRNVLAVVLLVAALVILGTVFAMFRLNQRTAPAPVVSAFDRLVQAIAELDEQFEQGKIPQDQYEAERARLKAELAKSLES